MAVSEGKKYNQLIIDRMIIIIIMIILIGGFFAGAISIPKHNSLQLINDRIESEQCKESGLFFNQNTLFEIYKCPNGNTYMKPQ